MLFSTIERNKIYRTMQWQSLFIMYEHFQDIDDIVGDVRVINNDIIGFTETQIYPSDLILTLKTMKINFQV